MESSRGLLIVAALSCALLLSALGWKAGEYFHLTGPTAPRVERPPVHIPSPFVKETDTDGDGLPDWQETLLGLDPQNADTDGDGTPDTAPLPTGFSIATTATGAVTERLITDYLYLKENNSFTPERGEQLATSLSDNLYVRTDFTPYTNTDITTKNDTSAASVEAYRKDLQKATAPFFELQKAEFELYAEYVNSGDTSYLDQLKVRAELYKNVAAQVVAVHPPEDIASTHIETANALAYFGAVLLDLVAYKDDPIASFAVLRSYNEAEQYVHATFNVLGNYYNVKVRQ